MCGIAGIVNTSERHEPPSIALLSRMAAAIRHRGPDECGVYRDPNAGLVNVRLSIVDPFTGQQPMATADEDFFITFNGEVFNFIEIRTELQLLGYRFKTQSDTEVVLYAFREWGESCFRKFNGQWALAIWNPGERTLLLARDPIGICPLFVHEKEGRVWFGSEVKAIFADPNVPRRIDPKGIDQTFTYWASLAPTTVFQGVEEIRPGSYRIYERDGRHRDCVYWKPSFPERNPQERAEPNSLTIGEATEILRDKIRRATEIRMVRADVPVGCYLSGGLDSSVTAWMGRQAKKGEFKTFSLRFEDDEFDESTYQRLMTSTLESVHEETIVTKKEIAEVFPEVIAHAERPVLRTAPAPMYLLSRLVNRCGCKAVITGEGADEMLAGYDIFREAKLRLFLAGQPESARRKKLFERLYPYLERSPRQAKGMGMEFWKQGLARSGWPGFSHEPRWATTSTLKRFFSDEWKSNIPGPAGFQVLDSLPGGFNRWDPLARAQYLEIVTLLSGYLIQAQGDRMLMAHSVEGRFPFLDIDVIEFCNSLPAEYKLIGLNEKNILKRVAKSFIPGEIIGRKKQPYRSPDAICFLSPGAPDYVREMFSREALQKAGIFNPGAALKLYEKCRGSSLPGAVHAPLSNIDNMGFIGILSTQLLDREFISSPADPAGAGIHFTTFIDRVHEMSH